MKFPNLIPYLLTIALLFSVSNEPLFAQSPADAEAKMSYYLPADVSYDASIPTPEDVLGMVPGEWHVRHDQLLKYMHAIAGASDRVSITEFGKTYENRSLIYLTVTSPSNQQNIDQLRQNHLALTDPGESSSLNVEEMPVVLYMGYSIHGDEPSGSNAALLFAYHLAAAQGPEIEKMLNNSIILLDPSLNPDGLNRFAHWVNTRKSKNIVDDPNNLEQNQEWPSARTNHYWFDLNRDWMLVQHPTSQGRIDNFHKWKPNILTDHHEMSTNATYFFQPGVPSRTHPLTSDQNQKLTGAIAEYHADILDDHKRLYYSEEIFDDFYYGKGSTYPDINGGIGILFEQASARAHAQESIHGVLKFPFAIKNQFLTSLSTLQAAQDLRVEILNYQRNFFREAEKQASRSSVKAYVFGTDADRARSYHLAEMLHRHDIRVHELARDISISGKTFEAGSSYIVPADQYQYRFIEAMFETRTAFQDSIFYDVSSWTMPFAFNLPYEALESREFDDDQLGAEFELKGIPAGAVIGGKSEYAYLFEWDGYYAPRALNRILKNGVRAKVAAEPFTAVTSEGTHRFDYGTIMVPLGPQEVEAGMIHELMTKAATEDGLRVYAVPTGATPQGIDLGSSTFNSVEDPDVAIIVGEGTSAYEAGEAWHLMDQRYGMEVTLLTKERLHDKDTDIDRYSAIVMVNGEYNDISERSKAKMKRWVNNGGTLVAYKEAVEWVNKNGFSRIEIIDDRMVNGGSPKPYSTMDRTEGAQEIGGTIFYGKLDTTHPIGYGYNSDRITIFRNGTLFMKKADNPYATPLRYTDNPLASGYISDDNLEKVKGSAAVIVNKLGNGRVITMSDNPNFRAFWYGTNKLFANAIFFGNTIEGSSAN